MSVEDSSVGFHDQIATGDFRGKLLKDAIRLSAVGDRIPGVDVLGLVLRRSLTTS